MNALININKYTEENQPSRELEPGASNSPIYVFCSNTQLNFYRR